MAKPQTGYFDYNSIFIIESLPYGEAKTGRALYDYLQGEELVKNGAITLDFVEVRDREELTNQLELLFTKTKAGTLPIIQIETHGYEKGIELMNGECIEFTELFEYLKSINIASGFNLMIMMSACFGGLLPYIIKFTEPAPFWGIIGPSNVVTPKSLKDGFCAFYSTLFNTSDTNQSFARLWQERINTTEGYLFYPAELLFINAFASYLQDRILKGVHSVEELKHDFIMDQGLIPNAEHRKFLNREVYSKLGNVAIFEKMKNVFFGYELIPDNKDRFDYCFDDILDATGKVLSETKVQAK